MSVCKPCGSFERFFVYLYSAKTKRGVKPLFIFGGDSRTQNLNKRYREAAFKRTRLACKSNAYAFERFFVYLYSAKTKRGIKPLFVFGGDSRTRICDPLHVKQVL